MDVASSRREKVVLVGCALKSAPKTSAKQSSLSLEESLDELASLTASAGGTVVERLVQEREQYDSASLIGSGKLNELEEVSRELQADVVIFDENLSPAQQRNIERKIGCRVIDRTQLILDIFASRARTREGKLQVELAQLNYMLPASQDAVWSSQGWAVVSEPEVPARRNWKAINAKSTSAFTRSRKIWNVFARIVVCTGPIAIRFPFQRFQWWATPTRANPHCSTL